MKPKNLILRRRLAYVESQLETESTSNRHSSRLKEERRRRLTEEKNAIQKSLDSIVYPILTIPVEITAEIFIHCLPDTPAPPSSRMAPMLLARICRQWRDIACSTPRLWAALRITRWKGSDLALLIRLWFGRAGGAPKSLFLRLPFRRCPESLFTTTDHCQCCPSSLLFAEHWTHLTSFYGSYFTPADCLALLTRAPRLTHCTFVSLKTGLLSSPPAARLVLANLEHLSFDMYIHSSLFLLDSVTCPALRSFDITDVWSRSLLNVLFLSFLERAPHIEVFTVESSDVEPEMPTILNAMPSLTSLRVLADGTATSHLLHMLNDASFLPHITNIFLLPWTRIGWTGSQVKTFVDAVTSRWEAESTARLLDFELLDDLPLDTSLGDEIIACISALRGKGMRVHVGRW
ncbi:hypothetical protein C8R46DRAFT_1351106 [Mycena filopes]|nr:hypothetical protein C8R46DRAFT_1351106 [Mycena filopes]